MVRCKGITRSGKQCSVTTASDWTDNSGRSVAGPLCRGGEYCLFHAKPFCTSLAREDDFERLVPFVIDLETTGTDIAHDRIVEIAAVYAHGDGRMNCESFSTVVRVDESVLGERGKEAFEVHGISDAEISQGPSFPLAWERFLRWMGDIMHTATKYAHACDDDDDGGAAQPTLLEDPVPVLVAHNGLRFDCPLLMCELLLNHLSTTIFEQWYFVDTLHVFKAFSPYGCIKLQCLARDTMTDPGHAHRALDDCVALRKITEIFAQRVGIPTKRLLSLFLMDLDLNSSVAQLRTLM